MALQISRWYDEIAVNAPGISQAGMDLAIHGSISEFLRRSGAYAKAINSISLTAGLDTYILPNQPEGPILFIYAVYFNGRPMPFTDAMRWETLPDATGTPNTYRAYVDDPYKISVHPTPELDDEAGITPFVAFGYDPRCIEYMPEIFVTQWYDALLSGALYRLYMQPNKPYSNLGLAKFHGNMFRDGINQAKDQARKQFVRSETYLLFPRWGA